MQEHGIITGKKSPKGHVLVQQMRNSGSVSQYGQVLYIIKTYLVEGSYDTDDYLKLNLDPVFLEKFNRSDMSEMEQNLHILQYELSKIGRPLNGSEITERIDWYQKLSKVIQFNLAFEIQRSAPQIGRGVRYMSKAVGELGQIKEDTAKSKEGVAHLKNKIVQNARTAMNLMRKKQALQ